MWWVVEEGMTLDGWAVCDGDEERAERVAVRSWRNSI